jgi:hypothetical protein
MARITKKDRNELFAIRRSVEFLIKMATDPRGPMEDLGTREQILESAGHLKLCLDAGIRQADKML